MIVFRSLAQSCNDYCRHLLAVIWIIEQTFLLKIEQQERPRYDWKAKWVMRGESADTTPEERQHATKGTGAGEMCFTPATEPPDAVKVKVAPVLNWLSAASWRHDRLCGLVVRVLGYRSGGPGSILGTTKKNSSGYGTGSTQPREYNWGATW
jgi:hypothetical protein